MKNQQNKDEEDKARVAARKMEIFRHHGRGPRLCEDIGHQTEPAIHKDLQDIASTKS